MKLINDHNTAVRISDVCNKCFRAGLGATLLVTLLFASSCKKGGFLDPKTQSVIDEHAIFSDSIYTVQYINSRYTNVDISYEPNRFSSNGSGGLESACDEAESATDPTKLHNIITTGALTPANVGTDVWGPIYAQIRAINIFIRNEPSLPVKAESTKKYWDGQVRFLRAWYYAILLKHYGGIPIVGNTVFTADQTIDVPRSTYEQTVNYIISECDDIAPNLPLNNLGAAPTFSPTPDYGRATRGAALALKARVLLYAASPLTNTSRSDDANHLVSYGNTDLNRWKLAADAAQAVINLNQNSLYRASSPAFYQTFLTTTNPESVFAYYPPTTTPNNMFRETFCNPISRGTRYSATVSMFPSQEMVDAFGMQNGKAITDPTSGYPGIGNNMYLNRDPRFYYTVLYNGALRAENGYATAQPVWTYTGVLASGNTNLNSVAIDGIYQSNGTKTGYYCYKMCADGVGPLGQELNRPRNLIRYAEVLLNAAEATNEFSGPSAQIYAWIGDIRNRAGIAAGTDGLYGMKANMTQGEMRTFLQNERQVELAFEEHRFWDIRRWKIAPVTENADQHGMEITRASTGAYSYRVIVIKKHVFRDNMYFFPISQSELTKSPALIQNPGY
jgi:hypothetical protein